MKATLNLEHDDCEVKVPLSKIWEAILRYFTFMMPEWARFFIRRNQDGHKNA